MVMPNRLFFLCILILFAISPALLKNPVISGVLISNLSFLIFLIFLARLIRLDYDVNTTKFAHRPPAVSYQFFILGLSIQKGYFFLWLYPRFMQPVAAAGGWLRFWGALPAYTRFVGILLIPRPLSRTLAPE